MTDRESTETREARLYELRLTVAEALRTGPSFVTPGGLKYWPALDAFRELYDSLTLAFSPASSPTPEACDNECRESGNCSGYCAGDGDDSPPPEAGES